MSTVTQCLLAEPERWQTLRLCSSKQNSLSVTKHHFVASDKISPYLNEGPRDYKETFIDTKNWDLAELGCWWKRVEDESRGRTVHVLKMIDSSSKKLKIQQIETTSENIICEHLQKRLGPKEYNQIFQHLNSQVILLVQRIIGKLQDFEIRYDVVEFPEGDIYTVASTYSELETEKDKNFINFIQGAASSSKIAEYLRRYCPKIHSDLVNKDVLKIYQPQFYLLEKITAPHPHSIVRSDKWTEEQALLAHLKQCGYSLENYNELQKKYKNDLSLFEED